MGAWVESLNAENATINKEEAQKQADAGIKTITFSSDVSKKYLETAYKAGWDKVMKVSPKEGAELRKFFQK